MKRLSFLLAGVVFLMAFLAADTAIADEKNKEVKITGMVVTVPADPAGKLAGIAIKSDDAQYAVVQNAIAKKIAKKVGKKLDITGVVEDKGEQKILVPWTFQDAGAKPKPQPTG